MDNRSGRILRGDIVWANFSENPLPGEGKVTLTRPVVILSHTVFNENSGTVIAVPLTSKVQEAGFPLTLEIDSKNLPKKSWIRISQTRTLSVERLGEKITHLKEEELNAVIEGLNEIIGG